MLYLQLNEVDFRDSVLTVGFTQEQQNILSKFYLSKRKDISDILAKLVVDESHYHDLQWRFEVQVSYCKMVLIIYLFIYFIRLLHVLYYNKLLR